MTKHIYKNSALVEVVADVRWSLTPVSSNLTGGIDPFYNFIADKLPTELAGLGYGFVENLVPAEIPLDILGGSVVKRFRVGENSWPLCQIGPGVFTFNWANEYQGWEKYLEELAKCFDALMGIFPNPDNFFKLSSLELKYIDGFTGRHGLDAGNIMNFAKQHLGLGDIFPSGFLEKIGADPGSIESMIQSRFSLESPTPANGVISVSPGFAAKEPALILQCAISGNQTPSGSHDSILAWMNQAHESLSAIFEALISPALREAMQPEVKK